MPLETSLDDVDGTVASRHIAVVGTGYVGLVTALAFAHHGHDVTCVDIVPERVDSISRGVAPFYEPGVAEALARWVEEGRVEATSDTAIAVTASDVTFLCVGTPSAPDGSYDLVHLRRAARDVGTALRDMDGHHVVVTKSTVTPTANRQVVLTELETASGRSAPEGLSLASNPEFLREGSALADALAPDRVVIGLMDGDGEARELLTSLYRPFGCPVLITSLEGAELIKLTSNSLLAIKVAFANEVANLSAKVGADGYQVLEGVGMDHRLNPLFLRAGAGFGGSCFPKDLRALVAFSEDVGAPAILPNAALAQNEIQPRRVVDLARLALGGDLRGARVALLGLAFKPGTDDVRETRALPIYRRLLAEGARVVCHDPKASGTFKALAVEQGLAPPEVEQDLDSALEDADVAIIQTEWEEYLGMTPERFTGSMARPIVVDARRALDPRTMIAGGVRYHGVGWPSP